MKVSSKVVNCGESVIGRCFRIAARHVRAIYWPELLAPSPGVLIDSPPVLHGLGSTAAHRESSSALKPEDSARSDEFCEIHVSQESSPNGFDRSFSPPHFLRKRSQKIVLE